MELCFIPVSYGSKRHFSFPVDDSKRFSPLWAGIPSITACEQALNKGLTNQCVPGRSCRPWIALLRMFSKLVLLGLACRLLLNYRRLDGNLLSRRAQQ